jgi:hypothetical protein
MFNSGVKQFFKDQCWLVFYFEKHLLVSTMQNKFEPILSFGFIFHCKCQEKGFSIQDFKNIKTRHNSNFNVLFTMHEHQSNPKDQIVFIMFWHFG